MEQDKIEDENNLYSKVKRYSQIRGNSKLHPTQKPVELIQEILKVSSNEGDTVLDLFAGSFSTGVACKEMKRNCLGFEIDEKNYNISINRIENVS